MPEKSLKEVIHEKEFYLKTLEENGIGAMVRNTLRESLAGGYVSGAPEDSSRVFVEEKNYDQAMELVNAYLDSLENKED